METLSAAAQILLYILAQLVVWGGLAAFMLGVAALFKHMTEPHKPIEGDRRKGCQPPVISWL